MKYVGNDAGQVLGSYVMNQVSTTRLVQWFAIQERKQERTPYYCAPLVCVSDVLGGLAVWRFYKPINKLSSD